MSQDKDRERCNGEVHHATTFATEKGRVARIETESDGFWTVSRGRQHGTSFRIPEPHSLALIGLAATIGRPHSAVTAAYSAPALHKSLLSDLTIPIPGVVISFELGL